MSPLFHDVKKEWPHHQDFRFIPKRVAENLMVYCMEMKQLGAIYVSHTLLQKTRKPSMFGTSVAWADHYTDNNYHLCDPLIDYTTLTSFPVVQWKDVPSQFGNPRVMDDRRRICGIHNGLTLITRDNDFCEMFSIATDSKDPKFFDRMFQHRKELYSYVALFRQMHRDAFFA